jgi:hypothetical protein
VSKELLLVYGTCVADDAVPWLGFVTPCIGTSIVLPLGPRVLKCCAGPQGVTLPKLQWHLSRFFELRATRSAFVPEAVSHIHSGQIPLQRATFAKCVLSLFHQYHFVTLLHMFSVYL